MFSHADRAYTRSATTVRRCKCLVKVEVANVSSDKARRGKTHLSVHICTIHIYLSSVFVDDIADIYYSRLENTVGRRVSNHKSCEVVAVLFCFGFEVGNVDITVFVASGNYNIKSGLYCRSRVCAVS